MSIFLDGKGRGFTASVGPDNRMLVDAVTLRGEENAIRSGLGWQIASGAVSFSGDATSAVLFIENLGERDLVLDRVALIIGTSTGGAGDWEFRTIRNPTGGTIISNALQAGISNSNHGSQRLPDASCYRGIEGDTLTDGGGVALPVKQSESRTVYPLGRRLPLGSSIGWTLKPPTGNTAAVGVVVGHFYYDLGDS